MPTFNVSELNKEIRDMRTYSDSETGCVVYDDRSAFEQCRQAYFLKQQNVIPSNDTTVKNESPQIDNQLLIENTQLNTELLILQKDNANLILQNQMQKQFMIFSLCFIIAISIILLVNKKRK